jgi:hypothetical protein
VTDRPKLPSDTFKKLDQAADGPELQAAEARARRAFGLTRASDGEGHHNTPQITRSQLADRSVGEHQRTRFAQDGDVPVVYVTGSSTPASSSVHGARRLIAAEAALGSERQARQGAERALGEAQSAMSDIQTRLDHANLARAVVDEAVRELRAEKNELEGQLTLARAARLEAEALSAALARPVPKLP